MMPDLFTLMSKWWKQLAIFTVAGAAVATVIVLTQPKKYLATTTALAASPFANDRSRIFNDNIQALYPSIGTSDELDVVLSTSQLDTLYLAVTEELHLQDSYKTSGETAIPKAAALLKKDTKIRKGDYGELKIRVWHQDKELAPKIANAIADKLQAIHQQIQNQSNVATADALKAASQKISAQLNTASSTALPDNDLSIQRTVLLGQLQQYEMLINEFQVLIDAKPQALIIVERAKAGTTPDKPKKLVAIATAVVLSFLFGILLILILERRKEHGAPSK